MHELFKEVMKNIAKKLTEM